MSVWKTHMNNNDNNIARKHVGDGGTNYGWCTWDNPQKIEENRSFGRDHPVYSIIKIGQNTEKSPGDLKRPNVTGNSKKISKI